MAQPKKEQINDQRSYFTNINSYGVTVPVPFGTPDVAGGTIQTIQNNITENYYNEFLASTVTQTPGGVESDTPAFFFGNNGPFSSPVVAGASFTITLPGINSGNPVLITFQPSDSVNISSIPFITTSKAAIRINAALTAAGVNPLTPVAANVNGQLVLKSANSSGYITGSLAFISVNDVTIGVCSALGFTSTSSAVSTGITSPQRGIITTSSDGMGGYIQLRLLDGSPAITKSNVQVNTGGFGYLPLYPAGQRVYGRLQQFPGNSGNPKFVVSYVRHGAVPGSIITNGEAVAGGGGGSQPILNTDTFTVTVNTTNPALTALNQNTAVQSYVLNITFSTSPTGPQDVINAVNTAWNAAAQASGFFPSGMEAGRGGVIGSIAGPWQFNSEIDNFFISLNGQAPLNISPPTGVYAVADLANYINSVIRTAGQSAYGAATAAPNGSILISSNFTTGLASTVQIIAGDPVGLVARTTNSFVTTLNKIGLSPGIYSGSVVAKLYGQDEIRFVCPDHTIKDPYGTPTGITVSGTSSVLTKLGLTGTSVTGNATIGFEPVTPPIVQALIPEMMMFGEVPENIETTMDQFIETGIPLPVNPGAGTGNVGVSPLLGLDGKINSNLMSKVLDVLNIETLTLGAGDLGSTLLNSIPRLLTGFSSSTSTGLTLIWQASPSLGLSAGNAQVIRLYIDQNGGIWLTSNASWEGIARHGLAGELIWNRDTTGQPASATYVGQQNGSAGYALPGTPKLICLYSPSTAGTPFTFVGGPGPIIPLSPVSFDPSGVAGGAQSFLSVGTTSTTSNENLIPRIQAANVLNNYACLFQSNVGLGSIFPCIRIYAYQAVGELDYYLTLNASWNGAAWQKDENNTSASAFQLQVTNSTNLYYLVQTAANNTPWTNWTFDLFSSQLNDSGNGPGLIGNGGGGGSPGIFGIGGPGNADGVDGQGTGSGAGVGGYGGPNNGPGLFAIAGGNGPGTSSTGAGSGPGGNFFGAGTGSGVRGVAGSSGGAGVVGYGAVNGEGVYGAGAGSGAGGLFNGGTAAASNPGGPGISATGGPNNVSPVGSNLGAGAGVYGIAGSGGHYSSYGIVGTGGYGGVYGNGTGTSPGITGSSDTGYGVFGTGGNNNYGVVGQGGPNGVGIYGGGNLNHGIIGTGDGRGGGYGIGVIGFGQGSGNTGYGVQGIALGTDTDGVNGIGIGKGHGVSGTGGGTSAGSQGVSDGSGVIGIGGGGNSYGVFGKGTGTFAGVYGRSDSGGNGGYFQGGPGTDGIAVYGGTGTSNGIYARGGGTAGSGIHAVSVGGSPAINADATGGSGHGILANGGSSGFGIRAIGGTNQYGGDFVGGGPNGSGLIGVGNGTGNGGDFNVNDNETYNDSVWNHALSGGVGRPLAINANTGPIHIDTRSYANSDANPGKNNLWADNLCQCFGVVATVDRNGTIGTIFNGQAYNVASVSVSSAGFEITMNNGMNSYPFFVICQTAISYPVGSNSSAHTAYAYAINHSSFFIATPGVDPTTNPIGVSFMVMGPA